MEGGSEVSVEDFRLPTRLLKTDHFPNRRLNCYSKLDTIAFVKHTLRDSPEVFERIRNSWFGKLWDFPAVRCPISCKLIHALLCRQLVTKKQYEMWTVFGGQPLRFSLSEFASITGLHCGEFPEGYDPDWQPPALKGPDRWWREYIGDDSRTTIADIATTLEKGENMDNDRKLRLCLILLVDGVLCVSSQVHKPTPKYVSMLSDIEAFLEFPWGRESFLKTIATMCPNKQMTLKDEDPVRTLVKNLGQPSFRLLGFPLALQLLAFKAIPTLLRYLPTTSDDDILLNLPDEKFPQNLSLSYADVVNAENDPELAVHPLIAVNTPAGYIGWGEWVEQEVHDRKVGYLHDLIANNHRFTKAEWPGGATDYELVVHKYVPPKVSHKKHIINRKKRPLSAQASGSGNKKSSRGKVEECMNSVAPEGLAEQNKWLVAQVKILTEQHAKLAERTTILERSRLKPDSRPYRKLSTQRRRSVQKKQTRRKANPSHSGSEEVPGDHIISLKDGERPEEEWMDRAKSPSVKEGAVERSKASTSGGHVFGQSFSGEKEEEAQEGGEENTTHCVDGQVGLDEEVWMREKQFMDEESRMAIDSEVDDIVCTQKVDKRMELCTSAEKVERTQQDSKEIEGDAHLEALIDNIVAESTTWKSLNTVDCIGHTIRGQNIVDSEKGLREDGAALMDICEPSDVSARVLSEKVTDRVTERDSMVPDDVAGPAQASSIVPAPMNGSKSGTENVVQDNVVVFGEEHLRGQQLVVGGCISSAGQVDTHSRNVSPSTPTVSVVLPTTPPASVVAVSLAEVEGPRLNAEASAQITVSDSSPPPKRAAHCPSEREILLAKSLLAAQKLPPSVLIHPTDMQLFDMFKQTLSANKDFLHISQDKYDLDNTFFLELAEKQKWVSTKHMEVLMTYLGDKHADILAKESSSFASPWLINHLQGKYRKFKAAINKGMIRWDDNITKFVKIPGQAWLEDVHTVYAPMIWDKGHWVGLAIHLGTRFVEVLDPLPSLNADRKVETYMAPVVEMLPHIISRFCPAATQKRNNKPFTYKRVGDIYENQRSGDCGPVAVKYMEMHAYNDPPPHLAGLSDDLVDDFRKNYALELYREMVLPIYYPSSPLSPVVDP